MSAVFYYLLPALAFAINLSLLVAVLRVRRKGPAHGIFAVFIASMSLWGLTILLMRASPTVNAAFFREHFVLLVFPVVAITFIHFVLLYTGSKASRWFLPPLYAGYVLLTFLAPTSLVLEGMKQRPYGYAPVGGPLFFPWVALQMCYILLGVVFLVRFYRASYHPEERNRTLYIISGALCGLLGTASDWMAALRLLPYPGGIVGNIFFGTFAAVAMIRYQLLDMRVIIRKGLIYFAFSALLAALYIGLLWVVNLLLKERIASAVVELLVLLFLAVLLQPVFQVVQRLGNRLLYGQRYNYLQALRQFSTRATSVTDLAGLVGELTRTVGRAMQTERVWLLLPTGGEEDLESVATQDGAASHLALPGSSPLVRWLARGEGYVRRGDLDVLSYLQAVPAEERQMLDQAQVELFIPIGSQGRLTGLLALGSKTSKDLYTWEEISLLFTVANQVAMTIENARLYVVEQQRVEQLEELDRLKTEFLGMVAHQLKTPITSIKAAVGLFGELEGGGVGTHRGRLLASVARGTEALEKLVNDLLNFARVRSARLQLDMQPVDLGELLRDAAALVAPAVQARGQTLELEVAHPSPVVQADHRRLEQVLVNLLTNAYRYSRAGGHITLRLVQQDAQMVVEVEDSCGGIPQEDLPLIFQPYYHARGLHPTASPSGTGLGLAIAKSLVEMHGGTIQVQSKAGEGCRFSVSLPLRQGTPTRTPGRG
ncbi:MAG: GAF domain-containing protein [Chloroflexi bacterium]|nr:GAF domain-containing protein [Chloroflexota bacterium]